MFNSVVVKFALDSVVTYHKSANHYISPKMKIKAKLTNGQLEKPHRGIYFFRCTRLREIALLIVRVDLHQYDLSVLSEATNSDKPH